MPFKPPERTEEIFRFIVEYIEKNGFPPTLREIAAGMGLASKSSVHRHLRILEMHGYIKRRYRRARAIKITKWVRPTR